MSDLFDDIALEAPAPAAAGEEQPAPLPPSSDSQKMRLPLETISILEHNLSALYTTARLEVERKDAEIQRLRTCISSERAASALQQEAMRIFLRRVQESVEALRRETAASEASDARDTTTRASLDALHHLVTVGFSPTDLARAELESAEAARTGSSGPRAVGAALPPSGGRHASSGPLPAPARQLPGGGSSTAPAGYRGAADDGRGYAGRGGVTQDRPAERDQRWPGGPGGGGASSTGWQQQQQQPRAGPGHRRDSQQREEPPGRWDAPPGAYSSGHTDAYRSGRYGQQYRE